MVGFMYNKADGDAYYTGGAKYTYHRLNHILHGGNLSASSTLYSPERKTIRKHRPTAMGSTTIFPSKPPSSLPYDTKTPTNSALPPSPSSSSHCTRNRSTTLTNNLPLRLSVFTRAKLST